MKYFIDTEFIEGTQTKRVLSIPIGKTKPIIDLISIAIVAEDGREYYAISKDFNLREAWNRWQFNKSDANPVKYRRKGFTKIHSRNTLSDGKYWIRSNVLYPIYLELSDKELHEQYHYDKDDWDFKEFKRLIDKYGKTNDTIAEEVNIFTKRYTWTDPKDGNKTLLGGEDKSVEFYGYYADYDWVASCWLFGKMIDLPKGFPMYVS